MFYPTEEGRTTLMSSGTRFVYPDFIADKNFTIIDQASPADMPFALSVILKGANARAADIEFSVAHDGDTTRIWRADVPFNDGGLAELPLWSHILQIRRGTDGVSVTLVEQNSGLGPVDLFPGGLP